MKVLVVLLSQFYFENWFTMNYVRSTIFNVTFAVVVLRKKEEEKKAENPFRMMLVVVCMCARWQHDNNQALVYLHSLSYFVVVKQKKALRLPLCHT